MTPCPARLVVDPTWPWSLPLYGGLALAGVALLLTGLTVWTYLGVREAGSRRVLGVLGLRLGALLVAYVLVLRPTYVRTDDAVLPAKLIIVVDDSLSMTIPDGFDGEPRWEAVLRVLNAPEVKRYLQELQAEQGV